MQAQLTCLNCSQQYTKTNIPRIIISCGHTYCQKCLHTFTYQSDQQIWIKCPQDLIAMKINGDGGGVARLPKNLALMKVIQGRGGSRASGKCYQDRNSQESNLNIQNNDSQSQGDINVSKITKNSQLHEQQDVSNQLIDIIGGQYQKTQAQILNNSQNSNSNASNSCHNHGANLTKHSLPKPKQKNTKKQNNLCLVHKKPLDIVCIVDLKKICANCAIFGEHRGHSFKSLQQVSEIQSEYCEQIMAVLQEKQKLIKQMSSTQTKNDLLSLLTTKRNKLRNKILEEYQKIQAKLLNSKKQILKKLDQIVKKQETNFKNCMKFNKQIMSDYQKWQKKTDAHLKILAQNDFQAKLILLFEGKNLDGDLVQQGKHLIQQMKIQQQNILLQVQNKLQTLNIQINQQIYENIQNLISITCQTNPLPVQKSTKINIKLIQQQTKHHHITKIPSISSFSLNPTNVSTYNSKSNISGHNINNNNMNNSVIGGFTSRRIQTTNIYEQNQNIKHCGSNNYLKVNNYNSKNYSNSTNQNNNHNNLDQSLLENQDDTENNSPDIVDFNTRMSATVQSINSFRSPPLSQRFSIQPNIAYSSQINLQQKQKNCEININAKIKGLKSPPNQLADTNIQLKTQKMTKKRLSKMKLPQRYQKIVQGLLADSSDIFDLTNGQIGDANIASICENIHGSKIRILKLIRNKLTDQGVSKILPYLTQITTLNLSQNLLTDNILDILYENRKYLANVRTVILSQNKITQRKNKGKIDRLKKLEWNLSV